MASCAGKPPPFTTWAMDRSIASAIIGSSCSVRQPIVANLVQEFQTLYEKRELAALDCVNAVQFVLAFFEVQDFEQSRTILQTALDAHKRADDAIAAFHARISEKENQSHGNNRSAA
jgi:hypothetical protein